MAIKKKPAQAPAAEATEAAAEGKAVAKKRVAPIEVRLRPEDLMRFDQVCRVSNRKRPEVAREAIIWYLEQLEKRVQDARETKVEARIRKMENRMAALISRGNIDVGVILELIYGNMPVADRDEVIKKAHKRAAKRLKSKVEEVKDIEDLFKKELEKGEAEG